MLKETMRLGWLAAGLAVVLAACSDASGPDDGSCDGPIALSVDPVGDPTFTWAPSCTVAQVRVQQVADGVVVWEVETDANSIDPAVVYGTVPAGAAETVDEELLDDGVQYRLVLSVRDPVSGTLFVHASATFTAQ